MDRWTVSPETVVNGVVSTPLRLPLRNGLCFLASWISLGITLPKMSFSAIDNIALFRPLGSAFWIASLSSLNRAWVKSLAWFSVVGAVVTTMSKTFGQNPWVGFGGWFKPILPFPT